MFIAKQSELVAHNFRFVFVYGLRRADRRKDEHNRASLWRAGSVDGWKDLDCVAELKTDHDWSFVT